jgi:hypothetical protein
MLGPNARHQRRAAELMIKDPLCRVRCMPGVRRGTAYHLVLSAPTVSRLSPLGFLRQSEFQVKPGAMLLPQR